MSRDTVPASTRQDPLTRDHQQQFKVTFQSFEFMEAALRILHFQPRKGYL